MKLRDYRPEDREACIEAFWSNVGYTLAENELKDFTSFLDKLSLAQTRYYVVTNEEPRIVACGGFGIDSKQARARLSWGLVQREFQGQGFGRFLLGELFQRIAGIDGLTKVTLESSQVIYTFFTKHGFAIERITENFYAPGYHRYELSLNLDELVQERPREARDGRADGGDPVPGHRGVPGTT